MRIRREDIVEVDNLITQIEQFKNIADYPELYSKPITLYLNNKEFKKETDVIGKLFGMPGMKMLKMIADDMAEAVIALDDIYDYLADVKNGVLLLDTLTVKQDGILRYTPFLLKYVENLNSMFMEYLKYLSDGELNKPLFKMFREVYENGVEVVKADGNIKYTVRELMRLPEDPLSSGNEGVGSTVLKAILTAANFLIGKPVFFIMRWYADFEYTQYLKAKERVEYLNMKIDELTRKFEKDEPITANESKIIEYYEDMLAAARKQMADYEEEVRRDMEDD